MTVCTDVYVRPQTCDQIWIYPSQVHPFIPPPTPGGGPSGGHPMPSEYGWQGMEPVGVKKKRKNDDEEVALLIGLGYIP